MTSSRGILMPLTTLEGDMVRLLYLKDTSHFPSPRPQRQTV
eukprot:CAMPEP_0174922492 /NCGR_PEP_ID=MMETSP1355-20121228/5917_1 /TAXON_ID=464990 /ORGANISM="Hemiselmis tepida, Strain CCMP443" /LENGTH=40 /DNA_ID= /DNA_START= /DNA_END= /DNA_ORIENTATION=